MLAEYIKSAMQHASYKLLDDNEGVFGEIIGFQGLWANAPTLEACQAELEEALEEWIILGLKLGHYKGDIGKNLLGDILRQAGVSREEGEEL